MKNTLKIAVSTAMFQLSTLPVFALDDPIGTISEPPGVSQYTSLTTFLSNIVKLIIVGAGIFALFNFALAGYSFLSAGDDPKKIQSAWAKIYQSIIGLAVSALSIVIAAIIGQILFGEWNALLTITVYTPN